MNQVVLAAGELRLTKRKWMMNIHNEIGSVWGMVMKIFQQNHTKNYTKYKHIAQVDNVFRLSFTQISFDYLHLCVEAKHCF